MGETDSTSQPIKPPAKIPRTTRKQGESGEPEGEPAREEPAPPEQSLAGVTTPGVSREERILGEPPVAEDSETASQELINMAKTVTETQAEKKVEGKEKGKSHVREID